MTRGFDDEGRHYDAEGNVATDREVEEMRDRLEECGAGQQGSRKWPGMTRTR